MEIKTKSTIANTLARQLYNSPILRAKLQEAILLSGHTLRDRIVRKSHSSIISPPEKERIL